jgi:pilus assembly protein CpaE
LKKGLLEVDRTVHVLVLDRDPALRAEFEAATSAVKMRIVPHYGDDLRVGIELVRSYHPSLILAPMGRDLRALKAFTDEVSVLAPEAVVAATYRGATFQPDSEAIIGALRSRVQDFLSRPLSSADLRQLLERTVGRADRIRATLGTMIAMVSNKGGVGKSTMSVNVACGLARRHPERVLLIDASLQLGNCASMLNLNPESTIYDAAKEFDRLDERLLHELCTLHPSGLRFLGAPNDPSHAAEIHPDTMARILSVARRAFDYVVVDTFPMVDNIIISILDLCDRVFVVFQGAVPTVLGIASYLKLLERVGVPAERLSLVLNQNHPDFAGALRPRDVAERLQRDVDFVVPFQKQLLVAVNTGEPYVLTAPRGFLKGSWLTAVDGVLDRIEEVRRARGLPTAATTPEPVAPRNGAASEAIYVIADENGRLPSRNGERASAADEPASRLDVDPSEELAP